MRSFFGFVLPTLRFFKILYFHYLDSVRFARYSNSVAVNCSENRLEANIIYQYHVVEKGLTMPNRRWNFGHPKILHLIQDCHRFIDRYDENNEELRRAVGVLQTYLDEHTMNGVDVPDHVAAPIQVLCKLVPNVEPVPQKSLANEDYFSAVNAPFCDFAPSRSSVRNYTSVPVPLDVIFKVVDIAKTAPSACNRQATRVYIVQKREKIDQLLAYQNGNKGFGHLADKLLVLTTEIASFRGATERNFGWMDCGIFAMNLMYAFHHLRLGCCPLNAGLTPSAEQRVHELCEIPPGEVVCLFMTCGYVPDRVELTRSERKRTEDIVRLR